MTLFSIMQPSVFKYLIDSKSCILISVEHPSDEIQGTAIGEHERHAQVTFQYFIRIIEWILLIYEGIQQNTN